MDTLPPPPPVREIVVAEEPEPIPIGTYRAVYEKISAELELLERPIPGWTGRLVYNFSFESPYGPTVKIGGITGTPEDVFGRLKSAAGGLSGLLYLEPQKIAQQYLLRCIFSLEDQVIAEEHNRRQAQES